MQIFLAVDTFGKFENVNYIYKLPCDPIKKQKGSGAVIDNSEFWGIRCLVSVRVNMQDEEQIVTL